MFCVAAELVVNPAKAFTALGFATHDRTPLWALSRLSGKSSVDTYVSLDVVDAISAVFLQTSYIRVYLHGI